MTVQTQKLICIALTILFTVVVLAGITNPSAAAMVPHITTVLGIALGVKTIMPAKKR